MEIIVDEETKITHEELATKVEDILWIWWWIKAENERDSTKRSLDNYRRRSAVCNCAIDAQVPKNTFIKRLRGKVSEGGW